MRRVVCIVTSLLVSWSSFAPQAQSESWDESPLPVHYEEIYTQLDTRIRRPVVIANAGDGSERLFVVTQQGVVHILPSDQQVTEPRTFLDIEERVVYADNKNEEGLLGLAFHPAYPENGQFYVYYTEAPSTSVISRFRVSAADPDQADPSSEEVLMKIKQPYWNHNGGTLVFGPDGYLYIGLGDGGAFNDPHMNGQNIAALLGSILRIDVDRRDEGLNYAIPPDNPFVGQPRLARGEIYAYGFRNVWRMAFDRKTGMLWAADVGQDIWEEINIVQRGGNYGWNLREAKHKFGLVGSQQRDDLIDPIFEYDHEVGKSITGGCIYRGEQVPALQGYYLYADYVTNKVWGLKYDLSTNKVVANRPILGAADSPPPVVTFGETEAGDVYFSDAFGRLFRFAADR